MDNKPAIETLLSSFRVLDLTDEKGYWLCSKILGDLGAEITRLEKPGVKRDFWWWSYNCKKKIVPFEIEKDKDRLLQLVKDTDFLIESFPPGYLDKLGLGYADLSKVNPKLIMTSLSPFGQTGPHIGLKADDLEIMALSGALYGIGDPDRAPVRISFPQSFLMTSAEAAVGAMVALCQRELTGEGQQVDVSAQESAHGIKQGSVQRQKIVLVGLSQTRNGGYHGPMPGIKLGGGEPKYFHSRHPQIWPCKDGHVNYLIHPGMRGLHSNSVIVKYMAKDGPVPEVLRGIKWETLDWGDLSPEEAQKLWDAFGEFFKRHTRKELYEMALKERIEFFPGNTVKDILAEEQLEARHFWQEEKIPELANKPIRFLGPVAQAYFPPGPAGAKVQPVAKKNGYPLPFEGIKVLDFTWVYTGPWMTQWLAAFGAEVIKVESSSHLDTGRRSGGFTFTAYNSGKKSIVLNLKHPKGKELAQRLVKRADIVTENFSPGTLEKLGFGYEELQKINPRIILLSTSMLGSTGPHAAQPGLGQHLASLSGFNDLTGWPDRPAVTAGGPFTDIVACRVLGATTFAALDYQRRTGKGCRIDLSQFEAALNFLSPLILEYQVTGKVFSRMGNRSLDCSPHGVFPCQGEDRWVTITVANDAEWQTFCQAAGKPQWAKDPRFTTFEVRKKNEDELEKLIGEWTAQFTPYEVMDRLQKAGIKSAVVENREDMVNDAQFTHRNHFIDVKHPEVKEYAFSSPGFRLAKASPVVNPAPLFGEHRKYVAMEILGESEAEFEADLKDGVFQ
ncbi:MAG: CoA transferase [Chloroflexi bacterium]|nr:CoA transferase [Chloroflexota bacterium]